MLCAKCPTSVAVQCTTKTRRTHIIAQAGKPKSDMKMEASGYVAEDNSGKGNMFPTITRSYIQSPTASAAASQGLGGAQGGIVLAAAIGLVGVATVGVLSTGSGETLTQVQGVAEAGSLTEIASRLAASL